MMKCTVGLRLDNRAGEMMKSIVVDVHPPLYYAFLKCTSYIVGIDPIRLKIFNSFLIIPIYLCIYGFFRDITPKIIR